MAARLLNEMPDAQVHRGEPLPVMLRDIAALRPQPARRKKLRGRTVFIVATVGVHVIAAAALISARHDIRGLIEPAPIVASLIDAPTTEDAAPEYTPPIQAVTYALPSPQELSFESDAIPVASVAMTTAISNPAPQTIAPPVIDDVDYLRVARPVYPRESQRRREHGTVILRVLIDAMGRPAQIQVERSSGYERLDAAGREAIAKSLFRPHEVNGIAQPAQVLIPIEFAPRAT